MPQSWEQYIRDRELAEGPEDDAPIHYVTCPTHGEVFDGGSFCASCYVEDLEASEKLAAEWRKENAAERLGRGGVQGQKEREP